MRVGCWKTITKAKNTRLEYAFPLQQLLRERASMFRYTYTACLVKFINSLHTVRLTVLSFRNVLKCSEVDQQ